MKILYLASVRIPDERAAGLAISRQCEALGDVGHAVTLCVPNRYKVQSRNLFSYYNVRKIFSVKYYPVIDIIHVWEQGFYLTRLTEMIFTFFLVLRYRNETDIVYSRDHWMLVIPVLFGFGGRCIIEMHTKHHNWATQFVLKRTKKIVVISKGLQDFYENLTKRKDIAFVPSGVNLDQFDFKQSRAELRKIFCLPEDTLIYGYVGKYSSFNESKGVNEIIKAFSMALKKRPDTHLFIAGLEEPEFQIIEEVFFQLAIPREKFSLFTLDQRRFSQFVEVADILLMNYPNTEHYSQYMSPTKLFAYLATGHPIISSDLPSIRSIADDDVILFVEPDNDIEYSNAMVIAHDNYLELQKKEDKRKSLVAQYEWKKRVEFII